MVSSFRLHRHQSEQFLVHWVDVPNNFLQKYGMPVAMVNFSDAVYNLTTGNLIHNSNIAQLKEKIDIINKYDKDKLKAFFIKSLSGQTVDSDSTGNMGLIDMARKSGSKLVYQFEQLDDNYSYYIITVKVPERIL